jgi:hypothetical protein
VLPLSRALAAAHRQVQVNHSFIQNVARFGLGTAYVSLVVSVDSLLAVGGKRGPVWGEGAARGSAEAAQDEAAVYGEPGRRLVPCQSLP